MLHVLDASALIALIYEEKGAEQVESHLVGASISAVNLAEVATRMTQKGTAMEDAKAALGQLELDVVPFDAAQAFLSASILPKTVRGGLSLGDRACLALAIARKAPVLTADKAWKGLDVGIPITVIR